jgi:hypothetical protein
VRTAAGILRYARWLEEIERDELETQMQTILSSAAVCTTPSAGQICVSASTTAGTPDDDAHRSLWFQFTQPFWAIRHDQSRHRPTRLNLSASPNARCSRVSLETVG